MSLQNLGIIKEVIDFITENKGKINLDDMVAIASNMIKGIDAHTVVKNMSDLGLSIDEIRKNVKYLNLDANEAEIALKSLGATGTKSMSSIGAAIKGFFLSPLSKVVLAVTAVVAAVAILDAAITTPAEALEKMGKSFSEFETATKKVENLNAELNTCKDRIDELENKGGLTFVEQNELEKLRETTRLLQIQADLAEKEAVREAKEAAEDAATSYEKNFKHSISSTETEKYIAESNSSGNNLILLGDPSNISSMIAGIKQLTKLRDEATDDEDWIEYNDAIQEATNSVWDQVSQLADHQSKLQSIPDEYLTSEQKAYLDEISSSIEYIYQELDPLKWKQIKLDEILNNSDLGYRLYAASHKI